MTLCIRSFYEGNIPAWDTRVTNKSNLFLITSSEGNSKLSILLESYKDQSVYIICIYTCVFMTVISWTYLKKTWCSVKTHRNHPVGSGACSRAFSFHYLHHVTRKTRDWKNHQEISETVNNHISMINHQGHEQLNTMVLWAYFTYL